MLKILIVDDEELVRTVTAGMLTVLGHSAVAVSSGTEALQALTGGAEAFDVVLLDEAMPGMSGLATMQQLATAGLQIPVVICTGKTSLSPEFARGLAVAPVGVLTKPYALNSLRRILDQVIQVIRKE